MKDAEFMELLNLYLDHEISAADAARLEAEVLANPARRAIYRDYCRMQKGCALLATTSEARMAADGSVSLRTSETSVRRDRRTLAPIFVWSGAMLAAACLALVFLGIRQNAANTGLPSEAIAASGAKAASPAPASAPLKQGGLVSVAGQQDAPRMTLVADPLTLSRPSPAAGGFAPVAPSPVDDRLAWMRDMHLVSVSERIQRDEMHFNAATSPLRPELRQLQVAPASTEQPTTEVAAFRFTR